MSPSPNMTIMNNKIFIDSSILIEYYKGTKRDLFRALLSDSSFSLFINQTVLSEYLFHHLGISGGKAPLTLKTDNAIPAILNSYDPFPFLNLMEWLPDNKVLLQPAIDFMKTYNLLPNDALILASCKQYGIEALASHDSDFAVACKSEAIWLLSSEEDFVQFKART